MATRYGGPTFEWLLKRGWTRAPDNPNVFGDPRVIDPEDGLEIDVYTAAKRHRDRTGEYPDFLMPE